MTRKSPEVSVVMAVFNGARRLDVSLHSVLGQAGCDFECIVVDDGSTDATPQILAQHAARDARLRVIRKAHEGLTPALISGCLAARGKFIARQDCGDVSLPRRLQLQAEALRTDDSVAMVASGARVLGPHGEVLFESVRAGSALHEGLTTLHARAVKGPPHHGATMFRRSHYERVGGYRPQFTVAQDIDLWMRLAEVGSLRGSADILYEASFDANGISVLRRTEQMAMTVLAVDCAKARRHTGSDALLLQRSMRHRPPGTPSVQPSGADMARYLYFVASTLRLKDRPTALRYYREALRHNPLHVRALWRSLTG